VVVDDGGDGSGTGGSGGGGGGGVRECYRKRAIVGSVRVRRSLCQIVLRVMMMSEHTLCESVTVR
jgi:hypothetical protein